MDPQERFCHNRDCWAYGRAGEGHTVIHSKKERRYRCKRCGQTFSATKGSALYRVHKPHELVTIVVTLLAYGCPVQAVVAAFGLDERTIHRWQHESGRQCQRVHEHIVQAGGMLLAQVQADELRVRVVGGVMWLASALSVSASRSLGAGGFRLVRRHLVPNSLGPIIVNLMFTIPSAIFTEAFLSFIGLGIQVPEASLGSLIDSAANEIRFFPHLLWFPAAVFVLLMVCFNLLADGLRDAFDPKMRK